MIIATALSKNEIPIRLTDERWQHIITSHLEIYADDFPKIMKVVTNPDFILKGSKGEHLAVKKISGKRTWIVVSYKEVNQEKEIIWSKE